MSEPKDDWPTCPACGWNAQTGGQSGPDHAESCGGLAPDGRSWDGYEERWKWRDEVRLEKPAPDEEP